MSGGCLNIESQVGVGTSISVEWYALDDVAGSRSDDGDAGSAEVDGDAELERGLRDEMRRRRVDGGNRGTVGWRRSD